MRQFLILFYQAQGYSLNQSIELVNKNYDYLPPYIINHIIMMPEIYGNISF